MFEHINKPNFFYHAYTESSQDGFICWLIDWVHRNVEPEHEQVKACGLQFLGALFDKHGEKVPKNLSKTNVEIFQQINCIGQRNRSIDILIRIGDYVLLIEDKIHGKDKSNKLLDYINSVIEGNTSLGKVTVKHLLPIYLKTGNQSLYEQMRIEKVSTQDSKPYKVFGREDFLKLMAPFRKAHPIVDDFTDNLNHWEDDTQSYRGWRENGSGKKSSWSLDGFFRELENHLVVFDWDNDLVGFNNTQNDKDSLLENYRKRNWSKDNPWGWHWVHNPSGGFAGFWWYSKTVKSCGHDVSLYLQLEIKPDKPSDGKLCFKVDTSGLDKKQSPNVNLSQIKDDCHDRILKPGSGLLRKPDRMRTGKTMTVAHWDVQYSDGQQQNPWLVFNANGGPDIQATVKNLMETQSVLDNVY